jgi:hypothetical protein
MQEKLLNYLQTYKKTTVSLYDLENVFHGEQLSYEEFARLILELEERGQLQMVKSKGRNGKPLSLAYQYKINRTNIRDTHRQQLQQYRLELHPLIKIDHYFALDSSVWKEDLPFLQKIDHYLRNNPLPQEPVPAPERSFELVGDEKWITEKQGRECLERIGLWEACKIIPVADPLMLAINPNTFSHREHDHLIVENKTTYQALLTTLQLTSFTTLIYGSGKKIIKSIELFDHQLPMKNAQHTFYYFGDIDHEGISIWHSLGKKSKIKLALPFYQECLKRAYAHGKQTQRRNEEALTTFLQYFTPLEQQTIISMLEDGGYIPQEILTSGELQKIWRNASWN